MYRKFSSMKKYCSMTFVANRELLSGVIIKGLLLLSVVFSRGALAEYSTWQIESDLAQNPAFALLESSEYLYAKSEYVDDLRSNNIVTIEDFHGWLKALNTKLLPKPSLIPIGIDGLPIFIPTYPLPKRVGDKFVQRLVVLDQLRYWLGSTVRWEGATTLSEEDLIDALYTSGKEYSRLNGLALGEPLPENVWRESGHGDLIWPEFRIIYGEEVLVPIVYLTANTINNYAVNDHITSPSNTQAVLKSLEVGSSASMEIRTQVLHLMEGFYVDGSVTVDKSNQEIVVGGLLDVYGGTITAEENLTIAAGSVSVRPTIVVSDDRFGQSQVIGSVASVSAPNGSLTLNTYIYRDEDGNILSNGNIYVEGAEVSGNRVTLNAAGNIDILAAQLRSTTNQVLPGYHYQRSEVEYVSSLVSGTEAVDLIANGYINIKASDLVSDKGVINILAGQGIYIENEFGQVQTQMHSKIGKTTTDMSQFQTFAIRANLKAGKGININTDSGPIVLRAVDIDTQEGTSLTAQGLPTTADPHPMNGQIHLLMAKEQDKYHYSSVKESLFTIKSTTESWDRDTPAYNTVVGGLEVNATRGVIVEFGGKEGQDSEAQIDALAKMPGMKWMADLKENNPNNCTAIHGAGWESLTLEERQALTQQQSCIDFGFIQLMDKYEYEQSTMLSPAAMAVISIAAAVATGGSSLALTVPAGAGPAAVAAISAVNAGISTLVSQAAIGVANGALNGDSPYDIWKDLGSKENIRQLATSMVTAGALSYADDLMKFENISAFTTTAGDGAKSLNLLGQSAQVVTRTAISSTVSVLAEGNSLSDFGSDFEDQFRVSIVANAANAIGQYAATEIGAAFDGVDATGLDTALKYISHAAVGCIIGAANASVTSGVDAESNCYAQGGGAVVGELIGSHLRDSAAQQEAQQDVEDYVERKLDRAKELALQGRSQEDIDALLRAEFNELAQEARLLALRGVDIAKLSAGVTALLAGADAAGVNAAAAGAENAALYNAYALQLSFLSDALLELESFLKQPLGPLELMTIVVGDKALELGVSLAENPKVFDKLLSFAGLTANDLLSKGFDLNNPAVVGGVAAGIVDVLGVGAIFADVQIRDLFVPVFGYDVHEGTLARAQKAGDDFVFAIENLDQILPTMASLMEGVADQDPYAQAQLARLATGVSLGSALGTVTGAAGAAAISSSILRTLESLRKLSSVDFGRVLDRLPFVPVRDGEGIKALPKYDVDNEAGQNNGSVSYEDIPVPHEKLIADAIASEGHDVIVRGDNVSGPDALIDGVNWEIKEVTGSGKRTIQNNIDSAKHNFSNDEAIAKGFDPSETRAIIDVRGSEYWDNPELFSAEFRRLTSNGTLHNVKEIKIITSAGPVVWRSQ